MDTIPLRQRRSGLLVPVAVDGLVDGFRRRHNAASVARRMPPHVTVLFPFIGPAAIDEGTHAELAGHFATFEPFAAALTRVDSFAGFVWLAPEPRERFLELIDRTCDRFPDFPPYEGGGGEPEPHLTIAALGEGDDPVSVVASGRAELQPSLPFAFTVDGVSLFEELGDGTWGESRRFTFR